MAEIDGELEPKARILQKTIDLIGTKQDVSKVTIRDIAQAAGVGVGLINYHFQSKDKLVRECVQIMIGNVIAKFPAMAASIDMPPAEKLRFLLKSTARFLVSNPGISRVSILSDLMEPSEQNNSTQSLEVYLPLFREVLGPEKNEAETLAIAKAILGGVQVAFLHSAGLKPRANGLDFFDEAERHRFIDTLIDLISTEESRLG